MIYCPPEVILSPLIFTKTSSRCQCQFEYDRIRLTRFLRISATNIGPNLFHQNRTVSWLISIPRSCKRSSTLRSDSGNRTYSITARRITSGLVLKHLNGERFVIQRGCETAPHGSSSYCLTVPANVLSFTKNTDRSRNRQVCLTPPVIIQI